MLTPVEFRSDTFERRIIRTGSWFQPMMLVILGATGLPFEGGWKITVVVWSLALLAGAVGARMYWLQRQFKVTMLPDILIVCNWRYLSVWEHRVPREDVICVEVRERYAQDVHGLVHQSARLIVPGGIVRMKGFAPGGRQWRRDPTDEFGRFVHELGKPVDEYDIWQRRKPPALT